MLKKIKTAVKNVLKFVEYFSVPICGIVTLTITHNAIGALAVMAIAGTSILQKKIEKLEIEKK